MVTFNSSTHKAAIIFNIFPSFQRVDELVFFQEVYFNQRSYQMKPTIHPVCHPSTYLLEEVIK